MRILSKCELKTLLLYSPQHVVRLVKARAFSNRVQIGPNRAGWVESKVMGWLKPKVQGRADMGQLSGKIKAKLNS